MRSGHSSGLQPDRRYHRHQSWNTAVRALRNLVCLEGSVDLRVASRRVPQSLKRRRRVQALFELNSARFLGQMWCLVDHAAVVA